MAFDLNLAYMSISDLLEKAAEKNELIYILPEQKKIGKTSALIQYARDNHCRVLMDKLAAIHNQRIHPDIEFIPYEDGSELDGYENVVCDEGVPFDAVKRLHELGHILTGFISKETLYVNADKNKQKKELQFLSALSDDCDTDSESLDSKNTPLLQIELDDIDSTPRIFYKGEQIEEIINADFSYVTNTELINPTHIDIEYTDKDSKFGTQAIVHNRNLVNEYATTVTGVDAAIPKGDFSSLTVQHFPHKDIQS
ncbi:hypothetical protein MOE15_03200 [Bacillus atrophaeus]|uniref:hypothetical protein n=1 Tax=Bacillus atrophaeus TaxID=1452 RepID=UPI00227F2CA3|nr:hypothetical protein [Bacillus atrophaeus]MCY8807544.1 hypothetical protein [Bacillus atrophaeus]